NKKDNVIVRFTNPNESLHSSPSPSPSPSSSPSSSSSFSPPLPPQPPRIDISGEIFFQNLETLRLEDCGFNDEMVEQLCNLQLAYLGFHNHKLRYLTIKEASGIPAPLGLSGKAKIQLILFLNTLVS